MSALRELAQRRAYECRLSPDRALRSLDEAHEFLRDRGLLKEGFAADVVALDLAKVKDVSTFADPVHYSEGFPYVVVNGQLAVDDGKITAVRPGRILLGPGAKK